MSTERKYGIDSGWIVSTTDECTCGMGRYSEYGHESFCGIEQEAPVEEFDGWVKHMQKQAEQRGYDKRANLCLDHTEDSERKRAALQEQIDYLRSTAEQREAKGRTNAAFDVRTRLNALLWTRYDAETNTSTVYVPLDAAIAAARGSQTVAPSDPKVSSGPLTRTYVTDDGRRVVLGQPGLPGGDELHISIDGGPIEHVIAHTCHPSGLSYSNDCDACLVERGMPVQEKPPMTLGEYLDAVGDGDAMLSGEQ